MGPDWEGCIVWLDESAPIHSGDLVRLHIKYEDGIVSRIIKELRCSAVGARWPGDSGHAWWGVCLDGVFQLGVLVKPFAIEKVVAREPARPGSVPPPIIKGADEELQRWFAHLAADAVAEWSAHGCQRGVPFPGLEAVTYRGL